MKRPDLPYLQVKKVRGQEYVYFRRAGAYVRLPHFSDPDFLRAYEDALRGRAAPPPRQTFRFLIEQYRGNPKFSQLSPRTKKEYSKVLDYLLDQVGDDDPARMIRRDVIEAQMANTHRAKFANDIVGALHRLYEFAIDRGWLSDNPARNVDKIKTGDGHKPWPESLVDRYREAATGVDLLFFELCIGTGQRAQDVLDMRWSDVDGDGIDLTQNKTGTPLWIPFTPRLRYILDGAPKLGLFIVAQEHGQPFTYSAIEHRFRKVRKSINGKGYVIHGLRYTAAHELAAAGCTDAQIAAITGHKSAEMVAKYSRKANQRRLAKTANEQRTNAERGK